MGKRALLVWLGLMLQLAIVLSQWQAQGDNYYDESCPGVLGIIHELTETAFAWDRKVGPELLRVSFHDCAVNGCDAGLLLDNHAKDTELYSGANRGLAGSKAAQLIDEIKAVLDKECGPVVSCADIISVAVRDATVFIGGPSWKITLGRLDSDFSHKDVPTNWLPGPRSTVDAGLLPAFEKMGLDAKDLAALSGAHSVGDVNCEAIKDRQDGSSPMPIHQRFQGHLRRRVCRTNSLTEEVSLVWKERAGSFHKANTTFSNLYYKNLMEQKGVLTSDQALWESDVTRNSVETYAHDKDAFYAAFGDAMVKMKELRPEDTGFTAYSHPLKYGIRVGSCSWPEKVV